MKSERQLRLFMVSHPRPFDKYEDHVEALHIQLLDMIEHSKKDGDDPLKLIEDYLEIKSQYGNTLEELASIILFSPQMQHALHGLQDNWNQWDKSLPEDSLMYGGVSKEEARGIFSQTDLRSYLEALAGIYDEFLNPS